VQVKNEKNDNQYRSIFHEFEFKVSIQFLYMEPITANDRRYNLVSVTERTETGAQYPNRGRVLVPAGVNEVWHAFLQSRYKAG
jgi:hypothetical protein